MIKFIASALLTVMTCSVLFANSIEITNPRGQYILDMDAVYVLYVNLDIWTYIKFPEGYTVTAAPPGSKDFIKVAYIQNRVYVTKSSPENSWVTNLTIHITTPEGMEKEVVFQCIPKVQRNVTYGVTFVLPDYTPCNEMVKAIQSKYQTELQGTLAVQASELDTLIKRTTLVDSRSVYTGNPGSVNASFKGAEVAVDGIIENQGNYYVTVHANLNQVDSNAVKVIGIKSNKTVIPVDKVNMSLSDERVYRYVYKCPSISTGKKQKIRFVVEIWSKTFEIPVTVL